MDILGDNISSLELLDHMGDDLTVVNAARVSYNQESRWEVPIIAQIDFVNSTNDKVARVIKPEYMSERDRKLIAYLATHKHWTPFSHPQLQFRIKMPLFIAREWYRHTVGFTRNEVSRRYVDSPPEFFRPRSVRGRPLPGQSKQGSNEDGLLSGVQERASITFGNWNVEASEVYRNLLEVGVAPEQARLVLPQSTYTEFWETASLYAYSRLCSLRIQPDAQKETRLYAEAVSSLIETLFPVSWKELRNASIHMDS